MLRFFEKPKLHKAFNNAGLRHINNFEKRWVLMKILIKLNNALTSRKRVNIYGDVPKWLKGPDSKSGRSVLPAQEFKSLHLRQTEPGRNLRSGSFYFQWMKSPAFMPASGIFFYPQSSKNFFRCEIKQLTRWLACRETPLLSHCDIWNVSRSNAWVAETQSSFYFSHRVWYNFFVSTSSQIRLRLARD